MTEEFRRLIALAIITGHEVTYRGVRLKTLPVFHDAVRGEVSYWLESRSEKDGTWGHYGTDYESAAEACYRFHFA